MLTFRDEQGARLLTEAALIDEILAGEVSPTDEVRYPGEGLVPLTDKPVLASALSSPRAVYARRLRAPPRPWLALSYAALSLLTIPLAARVTLREPLEILPSLALFGAPALAGWATVVVPTAALAALVERAFGARTLLAAALLGTAAGVAVPDGYWFQTMYTLPAAALIGASLTTTLLHRGALPPLRNTGLGLWNLVAAVPILAASAQWAHPGADRLLAAAGVAGLAAAFRQPSVVRPRCWRDGVLLSVLPLLLLGAEALPAPACQPKPLAAAGVALCMHEPAAVYAPAYPAGWTDWRQRWSLSDGDARLTIRLVGSPESGFSTRAALGWSPRLAWHHLLLWRQASRAAPYAVATSCAGSDTITCARARYLSGDVAAAQALAEPRADLGDATSPMARELLLRAWAAQPALAPPDRVARTLRWMRETANGSSAHWELLGPLADSLAPDHCAEALAGARQWAPSERAAAQVPAMLSPRCGE